MRQYANSPIIQQIVEFWKQNFNADIEEDFYNLIWNIDTASSYGLDVWGRIVGIGRYLTIPGTVNSFGFDTGTADWSPFNVDPFYTPDRVTDTYRLEDVEYRRLILVKAVSNIFGGSSQEINRMLQMLFDEGAFVVDNGNMRMTYLFKFFLEPYERAIIDAQILGRPAGVLVDVAEMPDGTYLGFSEADDLSYTPFDAGIFFTG